MTWGHHHENIHFSKVSSILDNPSDAFQEFTRYVKVCLFDSMTLKIKQGAGARIVWAYETQEPHANLLHFTNLHVFSLVDERNYT